MMDGKDCAHGSSSSSRSASDGVDGPGERGAAATVTGQEESSHGDTDWAPWAQRVLVTASGSQDVVTISNIGELLPGDQRVQS